MILLDIYGYQIEKIKCFYYSINFKGNQCSGNNEVETITFPYLA